MDSWSSSLRTPAAPRSIFSDTRRTDSAAAVDARVHLTTQLLSQLKASELDAHSTCCEATTTIVQLRVVLMHLTELVLVATQNLQKEADAH